MADVLDRNIHQIDNPLQVNTRGAGFGGVDGTGASQSGRYW